MENRLRNPWIGVGAAIVGAAIGHLLFMAILRQGFYALVVPGFATGLAYSLWTKQRCVPCMVLCGIVALLAGLLSEWRAAPFAVDSSLGYFLTHWPQLRPFTLLSLAAGTGIAVWMSRGRHSAI